MFLWFPPPHPNRFWSHIQWLPEVEGPESERAEVKNA